VLRHITELGKEGTVFVLTLYAIVQRPDGFLNEVGGQPVAKVQIIDSARTDGPWASGSDGGVTLDYPDRHPGQRVQLVVNREGYVVINELQLNLALPADSDARPLQLFSAKRPIAKRWRGAFTGSGVLKLLRRLTRGRQVKGLEATAYRNALEVYTRERLPQVWAAVQTTWEKHSRHRGSGPGFSGQ
jgi:hypothetical protein